MLRNNLIRCCLPKYHPSNIITTTTIPHTFTNKLISVRHQSTTTTEVNTNESINSMTDAEVDQWLNSIQELRSQFKQSGFNPEIDLSPPGKGKLDLTKAKQQITAKSFKPTELQIKEWESLKNIPLPKREDPILQQITNIIMRDGKKQLAEKIISRSLYLVFLQTRKDPINLLKKSLDELAPLMIVKTFNTGVAKAAVIPVPLTLRQRTRIAWKWIIDASKNRASSDFAVRLAEEIIAVSNGLGSAFDKRDQIHKTAITHRSYIKLK